MNEFVQTAVLTTRSGLRKCARPGGRAMPPKKRPNGKAPAVPVVDLTNDDDVFVNPNSALPKRALGGTITPAVNGDSDCVILGESPGESLAAPRQLHAAMDRVAWQAPQQPLHRSEEPAGWS